MTAAIQVSQISKRYLIMRNQGKGSYRTLRDDMLALPRQLWARARGQHHDPREPVWALHDVSFSVQPGEVVGVIGRNGAGKSTLLKILSRITEPTSGWAAIRGRVGSLLEVGTGFHPELTGRENIFLNGAILGMHRSEIARKFDEIVAFAEIEQYIDTPVKRYSSGMYMRLAFAVAAHLEPEILIVDEVLAVGDAQFQRKCLGRMGEIAQEGRTVLFVSHNMGAVRALCTRGVVLERGRVTLQGEVGAAVDYYLQHATASRARTVRLDDPPDRPIAFEELRVVAPGKRETDGLDINDALEVHVRYRVREDTSGTNLGLTLTRDGITMFRSFDTDCDQEMFRLRPAGTYHVRLVLPRRLLVAGTYSIGVAAGRVSQSVIAAHPEVLTFELEELSEDMTHKSYARRRGGLLIMPLDWQHEPVSA